MVILAAALAMVTLLVVTAIAVVGVLGVVGSIHLVPCPSCHHMVRTIPPSASFCVHCHYQRTRHVLHLDRASGSVTP